MELSATEMVTLVSLVVTGFLASNTDNLLILVVLLGAHKHRRSAVLVGYLASCIAVICTSVVGVLVGSVIGVHLIGYLGLIPLLLGLQLLYQNWRLPDDDRDAMLSTPGNAGEPGIWLTAFALMFSNSGDSIAIFLPLIAEGGRAGLLVIVGGYLVMALLWGTLSYMISGQRQLAERIEKRAGKLVPWIMIGVGSYILMDTATDTLI